MVDELIFLYSLAPDHITERFYLDIMWPLCDVTADLIFL